jgi:hypothetical protein
MGSSRTFRVIVGVAGLVASGVVFTYWWRTEMSRDNAYGMFMFASVLGLAGLNSLFRSMGFNFPPTGSDAGTDIFDGDGGD